MAVPLPLKFRVPQVEMYNGSRDPFKHLETFKTRMTQHGFLGEISCRTFPLTLKGAARGWLGSLVPRSINIIAKLARLYLIQFMASRKRRCSTAYLLTIKQTENEVLKAYLDRFNKERMMTNYQDEKIP